MGQSITLELPDDLSRMVQDEARRTKRSIEDVLTGWLDQVAHDAPLESLPDAQILALCDLELDADMQGDLSELLTKQREGQLGRLDGQRLDRIMMRYRKGLLRKARAWKIAADRGLRSAST